MAPSQPIGTRIQDAALRFITSLHVSLFRVSGGKLGGKMGSAPILLLMTTGRKTGKARVTPLVYLQDGEDIVLVASKGGAPKDPVWWLNLKANPTTTIQIGDTVRTVRAHKADSTERARLWPLVVQLYSGYADYQRKTEREIPVIVLEPTDASATAA